MKIRADFVTNSSSVSYIVSFNPDMADFGKQVKADNFKNDPKNKKIFELLSEDLQKTGEEQVINNNTIFMKQYDFSKKPDCKYDHSFDIPIEEVDFGELDEKDVWAYIFGEYLVDARLGAQLKGFGAIQVPRDKEVLERKKTYLVEKKKKAGGTP